MIAPGQEHASFPSIARWSREIVITEKIDGTNAQVAVYEDGTVRAGSRTRWITPDDDNFGFARWVAAHANELRGLGVGRHYGEWWGSGIQRKYGLTGDDKRFSLFDVARWNAETKPACCHVVPTIYAGTDTAAIDAALDALRREGSLAAPGFMKPEGVVIFHTAARTYFKKTIERDDAGKGREP